MEVTRTNFMEVLSELDEVLNNATFLAIDGEFTGLNSGPDASAFDTPAQYYAKLRTGSMDFLLVQFGLSVFTYNKEKEKYSQRSYNFYVFPRPYDRSSPDCRFLCQASCISFLANQSFDFNKLFKYGIPYLTKSDEEKLYKKMEERQKVREEGLDHIPLSADDKPIIEEICARIESFIDSEANELTIDKCNAFVRRLVYQEARSRWPKKLRLESRNENGNQYIIVNKIGSLEEEQQKETERKEKEKFEVQLAVGLSALLRKIADSGKVIVGHNMLLDLCHIIHQFFGPLPETYSEFKALVHGLFPKLLDTKIICQSNQFKETVPSILGHLLETLQSPPFSLPELEDIKGKSYSSDNKKLHEAGYDAYITGICFIALCNRLGAMQTPEVSTVLADSPLLNPFLNKLLIARLKDYPHINLEGRDPNPSRDHVLHITFPKQWKYSDLSQLFQPYGGAYVCWLTDTTAYAALYHRDKVNTVIKNLCKETHYRLQKYKEHQASLENQIDTSNRADRSDRKRKMSERGSPPPAAAKDNGVEESPSEPAAASAEATADESPSEPPQDGAGWELASGNNDVTDLTPVQRLCDDDVRAREATGLREQNEEFSVVRKLRLKGWVARSSAPSDAIVITASTRYTILSDLDDDLTDDDDGEKRKGAQQSTSKRSPKKGGSPDKRSWARKRNVAVLDEQGKDSPKRHKKTAAATSTRRSSNGWSAWLRIISILVLLIALYCATVF